MLSNAFANLFAPFSNTLSRASMKLSLLSFNICRNFSFPSFFACSFATLLLVAPDFNNCSACISSDLPMALCPYLFSSSPLTACIMPLVCSVEEACICSSMLNTELSMCAKFPFSACCSIFLSTSICLSYSFFFASSVVMLFNFSASPINGVIDSYTVALSSAFNCSPFFDFSKIGNNLSLRSDICASYT